MGLTTVHRYCATALPVISVINEVIFVKFGTMIDIGHAKVTVAQYTTFNKLQDGGGRQFKFSIFRHISVVNEDILVKFGTLIDIGHTRVTVAQYPTFDKIQDGGRRHPEFCHEWNIWLDSLSCHYKYD